MAMKPRPVRSEHAPKPQEQTTRPTTKEAESGAGMQHFAEHGARPKGYRIGNVGQQYGSSPGQEEQLAHGLGWFSIGLGLAEVLAPKGIAKLIGARGRHTAIIRAYGLREIAVGIGILTQRRPAEWLWARVAGDVLDLASLGALFAAPKTKHERLIASTAAVAGVMALDVICAQQLARQPGSITAGGDVRVTKSVIINRSPEELYQFWHDFENLPRFMQNLESVQVTGEGRSHWVVKAPAGVVVEWDARVIEDRANEVIAWRSVEGADVDNSGSVRFERAPGGRGTKVSVEMLYHPPAGVIGAGVAKLFGNDPEWQVKDDLRRFKQVMEVGEIVRSDATIQGNGLSEQRPAQPPKQI
jgi:uncharacterized membrane protein